MFDIKATIALANEMRGDRKVMPRVAVAPIVGKPHNPVMSHCLYRDGTTLPMPMGSDPCVSGDNRDLSPEAEYLASVHILGSGKINLAASRIK